MPSTIADKQEALREKWQKYGQELYTFAKKITAKSKEGRAAVDVAFAQLQEEENKDAWERSTERPSALFLPDQAELLEKILNYKKNEGFPIPWLLIGVGGGLIAVVLGVSLWWGIKKWHSLPKEAPKAPAVAAVEKAPPPALGSKLPTPTPTSASKLPVPPPTAAAPKKTALSPSNAPSVSSPASSSAPAATASGPAFDSMSAPSSSGSIPATGAVSAAMPKITASPDAASNSATATSANEENATSAPTVSGNALPTGSDEPMVTLPSTGNNPAQFFSGPMHRVRESSTVGFSLPEMVPVGGTATAPKAAADEDGGVPEEGPGVKIVDFSAVDGIPNSPLPFTVQSHFEPSPWNPDRELLIVALQPLAAGQIQRAPANLVFLVNNEIAMGDPGHLDFFRAAMGQFLNRLEPEDRIGLVIYAGDSALLLPSTPVKYRPAIDAAFNLLGPEASGRKGASLPIAYDLARQNLATSGPGLSRVIVVTNGDLNLGYGESGGLYEYITRQTAAGISLSVIGVGREFEAGEKLRHLIRAGHGRADTTQSIAGIGMALDREVSDPPPAPVRDLRVEITMSPDQIESYRLIGYRNQLPPAGSGLGADPHSSVVAVYEVKRAHLAKPGPLELSVRFRRESGLSDQITKQTGDAPEKGIDVALVRDFEQIVAQLQEQFPNLPLAQSATNDTQTPEEVVPMPNVDPQKKIDANAVRNFQQSAGSWIEPPKKTEP